MKYLEVRNKMKESHYFPINSENGKLPIISFPLFISTSILFGIKVQKEEVSTHSIPGNLPVCKEEQEVRLEHRHRETMKLFSLAKEETVSQYEHEKLTVNRIEEVI